MFDLVSYCCLYACLYCNLFLVSCLKICGFLGWISTKSNYKALTEKSEAFAKPPQNFTDMCTLVPCNSLMKTIFFIKLVTDSTNIKEGRGSDQELLAPVCITWERGSDIFVGPSSSSMPGSTLLMKFLGKCKGSWDKLVIISIIDWQIFSIGSHFLFLRTGIYFQLD